MNTTDLHAQAAPDDPTAATSGGEPSRKERRDAVERRRRILAAAQALFNAQGVDATSMAEIARTAQVGQGTLYRHYAHKGELCVALLGEHVQRLRADVQARVARVKAGDPALAQLEFLLVRLVEFNEANAPLLGAIGDAACGNRRAAAYQSPLYTWLRETVSTLLRCALAQGETGELDVDATVDAVLAPLAIDLYLYQRHTLGHPPERITAAVRRLLFAGLRRDAEET